MDRYTKVVLTVIAAALVWIACRGSLGVAYAGKNDPARVVICDPTNPNVCARVMKHYASEWDYLMTRP